jgi:hypothetical protein
MVKWTEKVNNGNNLNTEGIYNFSLLWTYQGKTMACASLMYQKDIMYQYNLMTSTWTSVYMACIYDWQLPIS